LAAVNELLARGSL